MEEAFKNELKPDSYYKIKSGIFGGDLELDGLEEVDSTNTESIKKFQEKEVKEKGDFANNSPCSPTSTSSPFSFRSST